MKSFEKRKKAHEAKFAFDEETKFKAQVRANKFLGLWVAEKLGLNGDDAKVYSMEVIKSDFEEPGIEDVIRKVMKDLNGIESESRVREKAAKFLEEAIQQMSQ